VGGPPSIGKNRLHAAQGVIKRRGKRKGKRSEKGKVDLVASRKEGKKSVLHLLYGEKGREGSPRLRGPV